MIAVAFGLLVLAPATPTLDQVLSRSGAYVMDFARQLSGIVGEEYYVQSVVAHARRGGNLVNPVRSELRSNLLLVRTDTALGYAQFRDAFELDGRPIRDRTDRLTAIFAAPSALNDALLRTILAENARHNIGDLIRTVNVPLLVLEFLAPKNQWRFKFKRVGDRTPRAIAPEATSSSTAFHVSTEVWAIEFQEREPSTLIRTAEGRDLPSRGRVWIEPDSGRVLMTELLSENREVRATIAVSFQSEPLLGLLVPVEMRERYDGRRNGSRIECVATYGKFRPLHRSLQTK